MKHVCSEYLSILAKTYRTKCQKCTFTSKFAFVPGPLGTLLHETLLVPPAHLIIRFAYLYILLLQQLATTGLLIPRIGKNFLFKVCNIRSKNALTNMQVSIINWATIVDDKTCNKVI